MTLITLALDGMLYRGWESMTVQRSIEAVSGGFSLELADRWGPEALVWPILPGQACTVRLDADTVITGYLDEVSPGFDSGRHGLRVRGRDKTADLVDCSALNEPGEWKEITLDTLAAELAGPFGLTVKCETDPGEAFAVWKIQPGESAFECLERAARQRGVLVLSDEDGNLVLTEPAAGGRAGTALVQGVNILAAEAVYDFTDRFSNYTVRGQQQGSDDVDGETASTPEAEATDAAVKRYRPLLVMAEGQTDEASALDRAQWEASVRAARSCEVNVTVQGWRQETGDLWRVNRLVLVMCPYLRINGDMLITALEYSCSGGGGTTTRLSLKRPDAFEKQPEVSEDKDPYNGEE